MSNYLDAIPDSRKLKVNLAGQLFRNGLTLISNPRDKNFLALAYFLMSALASFLIILAEPLKVVMRKNIGRDAISISGIILAAILLFTLSGGLIAGVIEIIKNENDKPDSIYLAYLSNRYLLLFIALFYLYSGIFILYKGINQPRNDQQFYRGDPVVLNALIENGVPQKKIWYKSEPWYCFKAGIILSIIHPVLGIPIILMAISFGVNERFQVLYRYPDSKEEILQDGKLQAKVVIMPFERGS